MPYFKAVIPTKDDFEPAPKEEETLEITSPDNYNPEVLMSESLHQLLILIKEMNHPEEAKIIGKLQGALNLLNLNK